MVVEEPNAGSVPAITRLRSSLETITRLRDTFSRDKSADGRLAAARAMVDLTGELGTLVSAVVAEAELAVRALPEEDESAVRRVA